MIKEPDWDETENQIGTPPEPDVLVKYVEGGDSNNQEEFSHGGQKVARQFRGCQALDKFPRNGAKAARRNHFAAFAPLREIYSWILTAPRKALARDPRVCWQMIW